MQVKDYTTQQLLDGLTEYRNRLQASMHGDKRRSQTKLDITFNKAMAALFETELSARIPF